MSEYNKYLKEYELLQYQMDSDLFEDFTFVKGGFTSPEEASEYAELLNIPFNKVLIVQRETTVKPVIIVSGKQVNRNLYIKAIKGI